MRVGLDPTRECGEYCGRESLTAGWERLKLFGKYTRNGGMAKPHLPYDLYSTLVRSLFTA